MIVFQNAVDVKDKIEMLCSRIITLVEIFKKPASDGGERKRREGLLKYAGGLRFRPDTDIILVNSKILKRDRGGCARSLCFCDSSIVPRTARMSTDFWKMYGRLSGTTWFVHNCDDSSQCLPGQKMVQQIAIYNQGCELMVGASPLISEQMK